MTPDQLTPEQKKNFDLIMGMIHRVAMRIAAIDNPAERAAAIEIAKQSLADTAEELNVTDPKLLEMCAAGIEVVVREIENSGSRTGGRA